MKKKLRGRNSKILVMIFAILVVLVGIVSVSLLQNSTLSSKLTAWMDSDLMYRRIVEIENSTAGVLSNEDVLIDIDTESLISDGKLQNDCDDLRFVDSDDSTVLDYWIEGGCNTSSTKIWVRIPELGIGENTIYLYYGNSESVSGSLGWAGSVYMYADISCPDGWTRASDLDGKFLLGGEDFGSTGGVSSHSHNDAICTSSSISTSNISGSASGSGAGAVSSHTHENLRASISSSSDVLPPYADMVVCYKDSFVAEQGLISLFESLPASSWSRFSSLDDLFPRAGGIYGITGGSATHTHGTTTGTTTEIGVGSSVSLSQVFSATGGTITTSGGYTRHTFTSSGTFVATGSESIYALVVGGGGGGGSVTNTSQIPTGGGGGGGVIANIFTLGAGSYPVVVGNGGAYSTNGQNSSFNGYVAIGGGRGGGTGGGTPIMYVGGNGGSGGGGMGSRSGGSGTSGQGHNGGTGSLYYGGGGGGAGAAASATDGGAGILSSITGTYFGGGGGAGGQYASEPGGIGGGGNGAQGAGTGGNGTPNTGGGGGGSGGNYWTYGGSGGSGIVVIRYPTILSSGTIASDTHTHNSTSASVSSESNIPPYQKVVFAKADADTYLENINIILMTSVLPPLGWNRYTSLDDRFALGSSSFGDTGGSSTHAHQITISTGVPSSTLSLYGSGTNFADSTHTHSCSTDTNSVSSIPPFYSVIYAERKDSLEVSILDEISYNYTPLTPAILQCEGEENPTGLFTLNPSFSAIFEDQDVGQLGKYYQLQISTVEDFSENIVWDSGKVALDEMIDNGSRSSNIQYSGEDLTWAKSYFWRVKFWDDFEFHNSESGWSTAGTFSTFSDTVAPTGSIVINSNAQYTQNSAVLLSLSATDTPPGLGVDRMIVCNNQEFTDCVPEEYSESKEWNISNMEGVNTVYVKYIDVASNESPMYQGSISLDYSIPTGSITIENGAVSTENTAVSLTISGRDVVSGISEMMVCNNAGFNNCLWEAYSKSKSWNISSTLGVKTVYIKFKDKVGLESFVLRDSILLSAPVQKDKVVTAPKIEVPKEEPPVVVEDMETVIKVVPKYILTIVDANKDPVEGAYVKLETGEEGYTDKDGLVVFSNVTEGSKKVFFSYGGKEYESEVEVLGESDESQRKFILNDQLVSDSKIDSEERVSTLILVYILGGIGLLSIVLFLVRKIIKKK